MTIRTAGIADADAIAQLHTRSWQSAYRGILSDDFLQGPLSENRRALWHTRLSKSDAADQFVLVDEQGEALRGFACAYLRADPEWDCLLDNLHVVPDLKGRGLGRRLMGAVAERVLRSNSSGRLHLWAFEQNLVARRFYERLGGIITDRQAEVAPDGNEVNAVRYCWSDLSGLAAGGET
jgi:ribosomal protein S18 acetylase RimI-like enzyme